MIKLKQLLTEHELDVPRLRVAYSFFIKQMRLPNNRISLVFEPIAKDPNSKFETQAHLVVIPPKYKIQINPINPMSVNEQIRQLAHEMIHIQQSESGIFDVLKHSWNGVVYPYPKTDSEYQNLPWEIDARNKAGNYILEFNRYMREKGAKQKITVI